MNKYRRTIVTLDDTKTGVDYMLFCVFEKLWPDMAICKNIDGSKGAKVDGKEI